MKENPYASPDSEFTKSRGPWVHSRVGWLIALTFLGVLIGASVFAGAFGTSPGDPEGTAMPAGGALSVCFLGSYCIGSHVRIGKPLFRKTKNGTSCNLPRMRNLEVTIESSLSARIIDRLSRIAMWVILAIYSPLRRSNDC